MAHIHEKYRPLGELSKGMAQAPINQMIDVATGYDAARRKQICIICRRLIQAWRKWEKETGEDTSEQIAGAQKIIEASRRKPSNVLAQASGKGSR